MTPDEVANRKKIADDIERMAKELTDYVRSIGDVTFTDDHRETIKLKGDMMRKMIESLSK